LLLLAVLGAHQLAAMGARGLGLDGYPESWQIGALWVDPRWPIQLTWLLTGIALLLGWHRMTVFLAWMAVLLHGWLAVGDLGSGLAPAWFGHVGPAWVAPFGAGQGGWLLLSCLAAAAAGGPGHLARALGSVRVRSCRRVLVAGFVGSSVAIVAAPTLSWLTAPGAALTQCARGPLLGLVAAGVFVLSALRRTSDGRQAVLLLALAALIPLTARWHGLSPLPINLVAATAITAAYVFGIGRRDLAQDRRLQGSPE
jgi:hypothetical protein